jgi:hypothetical protein
MIIKDEVQVIGTVVDQELLEENSYPNRGTAVLVGALFLIATATFFLSNALITPILGSQNYLAAVANHSQLMIAAALIALIDGVAVVGIAAALYPILKQQHPAFAFGYGGMRIAELAAVTVFVLSSLLLVTLSTTAANGVDSHGVDSQTLGTLLIAQRHWTLMLIYAFSSIAGLMLGYMLLRTRLVPQWLSVLGLIGYAALLVGAVLNTLGLIDMATGTGIVWLVPGGLFELVLPIWLFVRGFHSTASNKTRLAR